jgi:hypothetical protein
MERHWVYGGLGGAWVAYLPANHLQRHQVVSVALMARVVPVMDVSEISPFMVSYLVSYNPIHKHL